VLPFFADEPIIVFDLDSFSWRSDFPDPGSADDVEYYSRSVMCTEQTRLRAVDDIESWLRCAANREAPAIMSPITLAQDFDFSIAWNYCNLPEPIRDAADKPRHAIAGTLPSVHFTVKAAQYCTFWYTFFKIVRSHWGTPQEQAEQAAKPRVPVPGSGRSMTFHFKMHELKLDMLEEPLCAAEEAGEAGNAFALLVLRGFVVSYANGNISKLDMQTDGVKIQDLLQGCLFASSDTDADGASNGSFVSIQRGWAIPGAEGYPGHDTWWSFDFRTLALNWNDKTVALFMRFCGGAFATHRNALAAADCAARRASHEAADSPSTRACIGNGAADPSQAVADQQQRAASVTVPKSRISASFEMLSATLMRDGVPLTRLAMTSARCCYLACGTGECLAGSDVGCRV
jgi:hypothetical protein